MKCIHLYIDSNSDIVYFIYFIVMIYKSSFYKLELVKNDFINSMFKLKVNFYI